MVQWNKIFDYVWTSRWNLATFILGIRKTVSPLANVFRLWLYQTHIRSKLCAELSSYENTPLKKYSGY